MRCRLAVLVGGSSLHPSLNANREAIRINKGGKRSIRVGLGHSVGGVVLTVDLANL